MFIHLLGWIPIVLAYPNLQVDWVTPTSFRISTGASHEIIDRCLQGGIEIRYRYRVRYCRKRVGWFDDCGIERTEIRTAQFDPLTENYLIRIDRFGDDKDPEKLTVTALDEARQKVSGIENFPLSFLTSASDAATLPNRYVWVRSTIDCKREFSDVVLDVPYLLTFGLLKTNRFDSGWIAFELQNSGG